MKKIRYIILIAFAVIITASCTEDFLSEEVYDFKSNTNFYQNGEDANMAIIGAYSKLAGVYKQYLYEMLAHNTGGLLKRAKTTDYMLGTYTSVSKEVNYNWQNLFRLINAANDVLVNVEKIDTANIDSEVKKVILGEAHFLRGWSYFLLVRIYRKAPLKLTPTEGFDDLYVGLSNAETIYKEIIIPDFEFAKENCPYTQLDAFTGRVTKGSAAAALSKVYITLASEMDNAAYLPGDYSDGAFDATDCWVKARDEAKFVIDSCDYELVSDFDELWDINNKNTSESVFEVQYMTGLAGSSLAKLFNPPSSLFAYNGGWGRVVLTQKYMDDWANKYWKWTDGKAPDVSEKDYRIDASLYSEYYRVKNGVIASKPTIVYPSENDTVKNKKTYKDIYPYIKKWQDPAATSNSGSANNFIVIRYADVLLMYAEAENEVNGPTPEAYDAVDQILARARHADGTERLQPANWGRTMTKEQFRDSVWDERRFELCGENTLWFDLVRRGKDKFIKFKEDDNNYVGQTNITGNDVAKTYLHGVNEKNMYYPIPSMEISTNKEINLDDQNPGY